VWLYYLLSFISINMEPFTRYALTALVATPFSFLHKKNVGSCLCLCKPFCIITCLPNITLQHAQALAGFKNGTFPVLVATDVAARGLDITGVELVIMVNSSICVIGSVCLCACCFLLASLCAVAHVVMQSC